VGLAQLREMLFAEDSGSIHDLKTRFEKRVIDMRTRSNSASQDKAIPLSGGAHRSHSLLRDGSRNSYAETWVEHVKRRMNSKITAGTSERIGSLGSMLNTAASVLSLSVVPDIMVSGSAWHTPVRVEAKTEPFAVLLGRLLEPHELGYALKDHVIFVSTQDVTGRVEMAHGWSG